MANNSYFGFPTHTGTQYSAQATNYPAAAAQGTYVHQAPHTAAYPTATPRAQTGYDTYQTTHATPGQYAYTAAARQPAVAAVKPATPHVAATPASYQDSSTYYARTTHAATPAYDSSKTYYQPATQTPTYSATSTDSHYQSNAGKYTASTKPAYSTNTGYSAAPQRVATAQKAAPASSSSYVYQTAQTQPSSSYSSANTYVTTTASSYSGYDAALYNAATSYYQQQQSGTSAAKPSTGTWNKNKPTGPMQHKPKPKAPPQTMQLHYCDVCKISCAGPQTYREHLEGSKHKKKEAAAQPRGGQNQLWCELCNVTCTGSDAYVAHLKGAKHMKVVKLHTLLGKSIPSSEPVLISTTGSGTSTTTTKTSGSSTTAATKTTTSSKPITSTGAAATATTKKVLATPKITFVGGSQLKTAGAKPEETKAEPMQAKESEEEKEERRTVSLASLQENETQPVGHEYIEEVKNEAGKIISFQCKLCECKFNDPNAKEMHLKGRRHRLQYKKKVDPYLQVEVKPSIRLRKAQEEKLRRIAQKEEYWKRKDMEEHRLREEMRELEAMQWQGGRPPMGHQGFPRPMMPMRRPDSSDDRHVMSKHASIYPTDAELQAVQNIVSSCEKALKLVSDHIADVDAPKKDTKMDTETKVKTEDKKEEKEKESEKKDDAQTPRALKGVMRVGVLAKGLLLHGDLHVHLVVLCAEKPTRTLLVRVKDNLPKQLALKGGEGSGESKSFMVHSSMFEAKQTKNKPPTVTEDKYDVQLKVEDAAIIVTSDKEPKTSCTITLTSPIMREENVAGEGDKVKDPPDVLDRQKCLNALAALRHAKWFQARANGLQSCVVVIRILRDLCQRVPTWAPLNEWAMELLVEKCVGSGGNNMSPGDALRRVFECMSSGILLPGGPGLYDPCEKESTDAAASLSGQEREDITASAQHALRLMAFRQIHKVLGMDPLPAPKFQRNRFNSRKRRRTTSTGDGGDSEAGDGKKDKKDEDAMETAEAT